MLPTTLKLVSVFNPLRKPARSRSPCSSGMARFTTSAIVSEANMRGLTSLATCPNKPESPVNSAGSAGLLFHLGQLDLLAQIHLLQTDLVGTFGGLQTKIIFFKLKGMFANGNGLAR